MLFRLSYKPTVSIFCELVDVVVREPESNWLTEGHILVGDSVYNILYTGSDILANVRVFGAAVASSDTDTEGSMRASMRGRQANDGNTGDWRTNSRRRLRATVAQSIQVGAGQAPFDAHTAQRPVNIPGRQAGSDF